MIELFPKGQAPGQPSDGPTLPYAKLTLRELAQRIDTCGDPEALAELFQRTPFHLNGSGPVGVVGLLDRLRRQALSQGHEHADRAYDLTLARFSQLQNARLSDGAGAGPNAARTGTNCRRYFRAYGAYLTHRGTALARLTELERETFEAKVLQGLIRRHFVLSLRECQRSSFRTRYVWRLPTGALTLLLPRSLSGRARRQWLEAQVPDADPRRPNESARVQALIDARIGQPRLFPLPEVEPPAGDAPWMTPAPIPGEELLTISVSGLAATVAQEKAGNLPQQRPAIQRLGSHRVQELILLIFERLAGGLCCLADLAQHYNLSKASLSRFAGLRWDAPGRRGSGVPDLWRNTAKVIASDPEFVEAAKAAGVWQQVEQAAEESAGRDFSRSAGL